MQPAAADTPVLKELRRESEKLLTVKPESVVEKSKTPQAVSN